VIKRRFFLTALIAPIVIDLSDALGGQAQFEALLAEVETGGESFPGTGGRLEAKQFETSALAAAQPKVGKSNRSIGAQAVRMITAFEVSSETVYQNRYRKPIWPKGDSGLTIAIGYDLGYVNSKEFEQDWGGYVSQKDMGSLSNVLGLKGVPASQVLTSVDMVEISFQLAQKQFIEQTLKKYVALTESALLNTNQLSDTALGALVSLTFNRGASYRVRADEDNKGRYTEMRNIRKLMSEKKFPEIPDQIRSMKRLWEGNKDMKGLLSRREMEAELFEANI
jgi:GH24 family phage-related lysozyme (muramidase)